MEYLLDKKVRLIIIFGWLLILWFIELVIPLVKSKRPSSFKTLPNIFMTILLLITNLAFSSVSIFVADWVIDNRLGLLAVLNLSNIYGKLFIALIFLDFWAAYLPHILMHKLPILWRFHSIHHSDTMVDVTTAFRQHPIESLIRISFHLSGVLILGISIEILLLYLSLSAFNAQLEHANIRIPHKLDRFLQYFYVTPNMHKIHHSKHQVETDSNYSNIFSIWDRLFGTYKRLKNYKSIEYGLDYLKEKEFSIKKLLFDLPFRTKENKSIK